MSSKRDAIREAIKSALIAANTAAGAAVYTSHYTVLMAETYPLILIETPQESIESMLPGSPKQYDRKLTIVVSAVVQQNDAMDTGMDAIADQIEAVFAANPTFGLCSGSILKSVDSTVQDNGEQLTGAIHLTFEAHYFG